MHTFTRPFPQRPQACQQTQHCQSINFISSLNALALTTRLCVYGCVCVRCNLLLREGNGTFMPRITGACVAVGMQWMRTKSLV